MITIKNVGHHLYFNPYNEFNNAVIEFLNKK
jgi:hypothetical protein